MRHVKTTVIEAETRQTAMAALGDAFEAAFVQPTHIFEQYAQLYDGSKHAALSANVQQLICTQRRQLLLAARILRYSITPPKAQAVPLNLHAFMWESVMLDRPLPSAEMPEKPSEALDASVLCDSALLQPLLQEYRYQALQGSSAPLRLYVGDSGDADMPYNACLVAGNALPPSANVYQPAHEWLNLLCADTQAHDHYASYGLCFGYAALISMVHQIDFAPISNCCGGMAIRLHFAGA